jgi:hypothetical protein
VRCGLRAMVRLLTTSALSLLLAAATPVPKIDVPKIDPEPSCRHAAERTKPIGDIEVCLRKERRARDELVARWSEFSASDKAFCTPLATMGGTPTYTELLTCLDLQRDARLLREAQSRSDQRRRDHDGYQGARRPVRNN